MSKLLPFLLLLVACHTQHERLLEDLVEGYKFTHTYEVVPEGCGMLMYGFSYEHIMVFGWLKPALSDAELCSENLDMAMHQPSDITKFIGGWCDVETQIFTDGGSEEHYAATAICNEGSRVGLLVFPKDHHRGFAEARLIYKNLAEERKCVYDMVLRSDIMLRGR